MGDFNGHIGYLGPHERNWNGKLVLDLLDKWSFMLLNADDRCVGVITRRHRKEESVIDYVMVNQTTYDMFVRMEIDEEKSKYDLSDHCLIEVLFQLFGDHRNNRSKMVSEAREYYKIDDENLQRNFVQGLEEGIERLGDDMNMEKLEKLILSEADIHLKRSFRSRILPDKRKIKEPLWMSAAIKKEIALRRNYNRLHRNATDEDSKEEYWKLYRKQKRKVKDLVREEICTYEKRISRDIRESKEGRKKMWKMIDKLRGKESKVGQCKLFDGNGVQIEQDRTKALMFDFWKGIYQKRENNMQRVWDVKRNSDRMGSETHGSFVDFDNKVDEINIPRELVEHFDALRGKMAESGGKVKLIFDLEDSISVHGCLEEHMDMVGKVRRGRDQGRKCMGPVVWSREEIQGILRKIKNGLHLQIHEMPNIGKLHK